LNNTPNSFAGGEVIQRFCNLLVKLLVLNILTLLLCIPVVTAGASLAAMHDCMIKHLRKTDTRLETAKVFFQAFRTNFRQATLLWLPFLLIFLSALIDVIIILAAPEVLAQWVVIPAASAAIAAFLLFQFVMPVQAHFENTPLQILRSAAMLSIAYFPKTILMAVLWAVPVVLFWKFTLSWPLPLLFGLSVPGYLCARLYNPIFRKLEENQADGS